MIVLVVWDISDDALRNRVAEVCKDCGLHRVQRSAFRGDIDLRRREHLLARLRATIAGCRDCDLQVYPICTKDFADHVRFSEGRRIADDVTNPEVIVL